MSKSASKGICPQGKSLPISAIFVSNRKYVAKQTNERASNNQNKKKKGGMKTLALNSAKPNANPVTPQRHRTDEFKKRKSTNDSRYAVGETCPAWVMRGTGCSCL